MRTSLTGFGCFLFVFGVATILSFLWVWHRRRNVAAARVSRDGNLMRLQVPVARPPGTEADASRCPVCGAELPPHSPEGLCPQCVMRCVMTDSDQAHPD